MKSLVLLAACIGLSAALPIIMNDTSHHDVQFIGFKHLNITEPSVSSRADLKDNLSPDGRRMSEIHMKGEFMRNNPDWLVEGDIAPVDLSRKVIISTANRFWSSPIPYTLDSTLPAAYRTAIATSIAEWQSKTCLVFEDKTSVSGFDIDNVNSMYFTDDHSGCWSFVGMQSMYPQNVSIGTNCQYPEVVIHEIGHALGFNHEQSRTGRNSSVRILYDNIEPNKIGNFEERNTENHGIPYDYLSIMHYSPDSFEINDYEENTIQSVDPRYQYLLGSGEVLSFRDEKAANEVYCVPSYKSACGLTSSDTCNSGYFGSDCNCICPDGTSGDNCEVGTETETAVPCGGTITSAGTYTTPQYPTRANTWGQRSCVWIINAPSSSQKVRVLFDDFDFYPRISIRGKSVCYWDKVEVRLSGADDEGAFECDRELDGLTRESTGDQMVILINSRFTSNIRDGLKFTVSFF